MRPRRAMAAAGLLAAALTALLAAWFIAGWSEVRARRRRLADAPRQEAAQLGGQLGRELRGELAALLHREMERPYFHYQNLFHDPRSAAKGWSVTPSPLASDGARDRFVLGFFQIDGTGRTTTPTINDEVPSLSEPTGLAQNRAFRDEVARSLAGPLAPARAPDPRGAAATAPSRSAEPRVPVARGTSQMIALEADAYTQNSMPTQVYQRLTQAKGRPEGRSAQAEAQPPVLITVSPFEWRALPFADATTAVAVRNVETPDGALAQGFVVDRAALGNWLVAHAGGAVVDLGTFDQWGASEIVPGWWLALAPNPTAVAAAEAVGAAVTFGFLLRFVMGGVVAALAAALVVLLVARAEQLARERSQFAAAAAHELRTPLAGLQLYGDMLAEGLGDPAKSRDYARRVTEEAARLGRVVSNVLGFSQLERGDLSVQPRAGDVAQAVRDIAERLRPTLARAAATLALDLPADLPRARFDSDALARVVGNLVDNAEKYTRRTADRTIELAARATSDGAVEITVSDHGPGVADAARRALFQPFGRGVTSEAPAGLGLGLALSRTLARAMGGELDYRPATGGGATFTLRLPVAQ